MQIQEEKKISQSNQMLFCLQTPQGGKRSWSQCCAENACRKASFLELKMSQLDSTQLFRLEPLFLSACLFSSPHIISLWWDSGNQNHCSGHRFASQHGAECTSLVASILSSLSLNVYPPKKVNSRFALWFDGICLVKLFKLSLGYRLELQRTEK